jgi:hypothetical protein
MRLSKSGNGKERAKCVAGHDESLLTGKAAILSYRLQEAFMKRGLRKTALADEEY